MAAETEKSDKNEAEDGDSCAPCPTENMEAELERVSERAHLLIEALPYIREFYGKRIVIKYGGHALVDMAVRRCITNDIILMKYVGMKPVVVHGGGPQITELLSRVGKESEFVNGLRVTDEDAVNLVEMALVGHVNKSVVSLINQMGGSAAGLSGKDGNMIRARKKYARVQENGQERLADIGFVGEVEEIDPAVIFALEEKGFIPVIAGMGFGAGGETYNINADTAAGRIAAALEAEKFILLSDVRGLLRDPSDESTLISTMRIGDAPKLTAEGVLTGGMIPKIEACVLALRHGVRKAHLIDGRIPHALLLEVFTDQGIGTEIIHDSGGETART